MSHLPGDELIPDANIVFDRTRELAASPAEIWPWLVQLGKRRAGWYLPARVERIVPASRRGAWRVDPRWQTLGAGERIPDYGGRDAELEVASIDPARALVYRAERRGTRFSWALIRAAGLADLHARASALSRSSEEHRLALPGADADR